MSTYRLLCRFFIEQPTHVWCNHLESVLRVKGKLGQAELLHHVCLQGYTPNNLVAAHFVIVLDDKHARSDILVANRKAKALLKVYCFQTLEDICLAVMVEKVEANVGVTGLRQMPYRNDGELYKSRTPRSIGRGHVVSSNEIPPEARGEIFCCSS